MNKPKDGQAVWITIDLILVKATYSKKLDKFLVHDRGVLPYQDWKSLNYKFKPTEKEIHDKELLAAKAKSKFNKEQFELLLTVKVNQYYHDAMSMKRFPLEDDRYLTHVHLKAKDKWVYLEREIKRVDNQVDLDILKAKATRYFKEMPTEGKWRVNRAYLHACMDMGCKPSTALKFWHTWPLIGNLS